MYYKNIQWKNIQWKKYPYSSYTDNNIRGKKDLKDLKINHINTHKYVTFYFISTITYKILI